MARILFFLVVFAGTITSAYFSAQEKITHRAHYSSFALGMSAQEIQSTFGRPAARDNNLLIYILEDSSELTITLRDGFATSAKLKFKHPIRVTDPELKQLTLVQMDPAHTNTGRPNWFFAGKPAEGLIYKISALGVIESLTWVQPFGYTHQAPKNVQVLVRDFNGQELRNL